MPAKDPGSVSAARHSAPQPNVSRAISPVGVGPGTTTPVVTPRIAPRALLAIILVRMPVSLSAHFRAPLTGTCLLPKVIALASMVMLLVEPAAAQVPKPPERPAAAAPAQPATPQLPPPELMLALIRSTMIAINHANLTNNYTVLRDLGSPVFQSTTTPQQLSQAFAGQRSRGVDLTLVLAITPELSTQPTIEPNGVMRLVGYYPTNPRVEFNFGYQNINGFWRHAGISMNVQPQAAPAPAAKAPDAARQPGDAKPEAPAPEPKKGAAKKKAQ